MYEAAEEYFNALKQSKSLEDIEILKERLDVLASEYSDNPAYCALLKQEYIERKAEVEG